MVLQYIWPGCIRIPACCFTAKENDDYEKKKYEGNQTAGQKVIAGTCWNCDPWASGSVWSEYLRNNPFYQFVFWHIRAGSGSQRNIYAGGVTDRGNHFCWSGVYAFEYFPGKGVFSGRSWLLFQKQARQGDRCRLCACDDPADHSNPLLLCELYHRSGTDCGFPDSVAFHDSGTAGCKHFAEFSYFPSICHDLLSHGG